MTDIIKTLRQPPEELVEAVARVIELTRRYSGRGYNKQAKAALTTIAEYFENELREG